MPSYGVSLLSGGLDSTTVTALATGKTDHLTALTFHYGQNHSKEVDCAAEVAHSLGVSQKLLDISFLGKVAWYSALTNPERFPVPEDRETTQMGNSIPITYVPLRNTIFLSLAAAYLESQVLHAIELEGISPTDVQARIYMAPNAIDYSGYPDCRPEFIRAFETTANLATKTGVEHNSPFRIHTPLIDLGKDEIIRRGLALGIDYGLTRSCYDPSPAGHACGTCDACLLRLQGFAANNLTDPATYVT